MAAITDEIARHLRGELKSLSVPWPLFPPGLALIVHARRDARQPTINWMLECLGAVVRTSTRCLPTPRSGLPLESPSEARFSIPATSALLFSGSLTGLCNGEVEATLSFRRFAIEHPADPEVLRLLPICGLLLAARLDRRAWPELRRQIQREAAFQRSRFCAEVGTVLNRLARVDITSTEAAS